MIFLLSLRNTGLVEKNNMNFQEEKETEERESRKNTRKLNLIDNLDNLGLSDNKKKEFIKYYYMNLDMNLLEALDEFKKL